MGRITAGAGALLLSTSLGHAGALDRTGQPVTVIFEDGNYAELSFALTDPDVEGVVAGLSSGDVGEEFSLAALAFKYDLGERLSLGIVIEEPFGADPDYTSTDPGYPLAGTEADFRSTSLTLLGRYRLSDSLSVHGGLRQVTVDADLRVSAATPLGVPVVYDASYDPDSDLGYVLGAAYEREAIALRVALTYSSEVELDNETDFTLDPPGPAVVAGTGTTSYTLPQSINLDLRTGIAPGTALIGGVRWVDWSETEISSPGYFANPVVDYDGDYVTYTLGVGRQLTDSLRGAASIVYEGPIGGTTSNLSPFDGQTALVLGATYLLGNGFELTGGLRYARLGDATTQLVGAEFEDNTSTSLALRVAYRF